MRRAKLLGRRAIRLTTGDILVATDVFLHDLSLKIAEGRIRLSPCFLRLRPNLRPPILRRLDNRRSTSRRQDGQFERLRKA